MDKTRAFERAVDGFALGTKALAAALDMSPSTLRHKCSPTYPSMFLSPEEGIDLQRTTGDHGPLHVEAAALGYVLVRLPDGSVDPLSARSVATALREVGEFAERAVDAIEDGKVTANELAEVDRELVDAQRALQQVRARIAAMHEAGKPAAERGGA